MTEYRQAVPKPKLPACCPTIAGIGNKEPPYSLGFFKCRGGRQAFSVPCRMGDCSVLLVLFPPGARIHWFTVSKDRTGSKYLLLSSQAPPDCAVLYYYNARDIKIISLFCHFIFLFCHFRRYCKGVKPVASRNTFPK